jgi:virulence-associated protein VagC
MVYTSIYHKDDKVGIMESVAKLFQNGRSQAVRLPKEFRFEGTEVRIRKQGEKVILEPVKKSKWPDGFWDIFSKDPQFETPAPLASKKFDLD